MSEQIERAALAAAKWWADRLEQGDKERFAAALAPKIKAALEADGVARLESDYDPAGILLDAVREIGIECRGFLFSARGIFPQKHSLDVYSDRLEPKEGYGNWLDPIPVPAHC